MSLSEEPARKLAAGMCQRRHLGMEAPRIVRCKLKLDMAKENCSACRGVHTGLRWAGRCLKVPKEASQVISLIQEFVSWVSGK